MLYIQYQLAAIFSQLVISVAVMRQHLIAPLHRENQTSVRHPDYHLGKKIVYFICAVHFRWLHIRTTN